VAKGTHPINRSTVRVVIGTVYLLEKIGVLKPDESNGLL
jgi:hypothetical protein